VATLSQIEAADAAHTPTGQEVLLLQNALLTPG